MSFNNFWLGVALVLSSFTRPVVAGGFHYDIDVSNQLVEDASGKLTGLQMRWLYGQEVSQILLEGEDLSAGQRAASLQALADQMLGDLLKLNYFTRLNLDGQALQLVTVTRYRLELTQDQRLQLDFLLPIVTPQHLAGKKLDVALADSSGSATLKYQDASRIMLGSKLKATCTVGLEQKEDFAHGDPAQIAHVQCR